MRKSPVGVTGGRLSETDDALSFLHWTRLRINVCKTKPLTAAQVWLEISAMPRVIPPIDHNARMVLTVAGALIAAWIALVLGWLLFLQ
jgi:hypothetical protein